MEERKPAVLILEDGTVFHGRATGHIGTTTGEIAFNTGMTGYQEVFTDPSYYGQILVMNTAHIGNYGVHPEEIESETIKISGLITKKFSDGFSRIAAYESLEDLMKEQQKVGITDVDTRALVRHIRHAGAMNALISSEGRPIEELKAVLKEVPSMEGLELSSRVTSQGTFVATPENVEFKVALLDLGVKKNIIRCLTDRNCEVKVFPMNASLEEIAAYAPDGIMLSNGPGDPAAMPETIQKVAGMVSSGKPIFGICLGHQVLGLSQGLKTTKMFNGHRGINHPIINLETGKGEITSQNHGFVISRESIEANPEIELTHVHLNDETVAGIRLKGKPVFSVQYHPEASAGPHDSRYLFDSFIENMKSTRK